MRLPWDKKKHLISSPPPKRAAPEPFVVDVDLLSDMGCVRTNNEDLGRVFRNPEQENGENRMLVVVADGMGGYNAGEVASAMAVETLEAAYPTLDGSDTTNKLKQSLEQANSRIYRASTDDEHRGMGTTCTALLLDRGQAYSAHVGDSRLYLLRNGAIYLMTEDHSQVMEMVKAGVLELREARHHPDKNIITRALGRQPKVEVATWAQPLPVQAGDGFVLCSDGLCDQIEDDELNAVVAPRTAADACEELVRLAKERGGADNITVAVVRLLPALNRPMSRPTRRLEVEG